MRIKHKLLTDYQHLTSDKKIFLIKEGTILNNYIYRIEDSEISIDKDIINSNPDIFSPVDWKEELYFYIKKNKLPQPKTLARKLEPFMEDIIISDMSDKENSISDDDLEELRYKEENLDRREKSIKTKEDEINLRLERVDKRESEYKEDLESLYEKEEFLRNLKNSIKDRELEIENKSMEISEKERNLDSIILEKTKEKEGLDEKYKEIQEKINKDIKNLNEREEAFRNENSEFYKQKDSLEKEFYDLEKKRSKLENDIEDFENYKKDILKLDKEIKEWEGLHWKLKRMTKPPSVIN